MLTGHNADSYWRNLALQDGVTIKKTSSALVIGIYGEGVQPADGNIVVENLADYLIGQGI